MPTANHSGFSLSLSPSFRFVPRPISLVFPSSLFFFVFRHPSLFVFVFVCRAAFSLSRRRRRRRCCFLCRLGAVPCACCLLVCFLFLVTLVMVGATHLLRPFLPFAHYLLTAFASLLLLLLIFFLLLAYDRLVVVSTSSNDRSGRVVGSLHLFYYFSDWFPFCVRQSISSCVASVYFTKYDAFFSFLARSPKTPKTANELKEPSR